MIIASGRSLPPRQPANRRQNPQQNINRFGRTARHNDIHRNHFVHAADDGVTAFEDATIPGAIADRYDDLRLGSGLVCQPERFGHVARHRPGHEQTISVARRGDEMQAEAFQIVVGIGERGDFDLAAVALPGVHFADVQRTAQQLADARVYLSGDDFDLPVFRCATDRLSNNRGIQNLSEQ